MKKFNFLFFVVFCTTLYLFSCVSTPQIENVEFPFVSGADLYAQINHPEIIEFFSENRNIVDKKILSRVKKLFVSLIKEDGVVLAVDMGRISISQKIRMMKNIRATQVDASMRYWKLNRTLDSENKGFLIDLGYHNLIIFANNIDVQEFKNFTLISELPKAARLLNVTSDYSFWMWSDIEFFKTYLDATKITNGYGVLSIPEYYSSIDMKTALALPYTGSRSDIATLKLTLPFLFKSIDSNILGSLPEVRFTDGVVTVKGLQLPPKTVTLFLRTIASLSLFE